MSYRDELRAAQARARELEEQLDAARTELGRLSDARPERLAEVEEELRNTASRLHELRRAHEEQKIEREKQRSARIDLRKAEARNEDLARDLAEEREALTETGAELTEAKAQLAALLKEIGERPAAPASRPLPSAVESNRAFAPLHGMALAVVCPLCLLAGERVVMIRHEDLRLPADGATAICPRCRYMHVVLE